MIFIMFVYVSDPQHTEPVSGPRVPVFDDHPLVVVCMYVNVFGVSSFKLGGGDAGPCPLTTHHLAL